jgi:uncharacterized Zn-finger protein
MPDGASPAPPETLIVKSPIAACDGGGGALGHPRVFLRIVAREIACPYCSRLFRLAEGVTAAPAH